MRRSKHSRAQLEDREREAAIRGLASGPGPLLKRDRGDCGLPSAPFEAYFLRRFVSLVDALKAYRADRPARKPPLESQRMTTEDLLRKVSTEDLKKEFRERATHQKHLIGLSARLEAEYRAAGRLDAELEHLIRSAVDQEQAFAAGSAFETICLVCEWEKEARRKTAVDRLLAALGPDGSDYELAFLELGAVVEPFLTKSDRTEQGLRSLLRYPDPDRSLAAELELSVRNLMWAYASPAKFFLEIAPWRYSSDFSVRFLGPEVPPVAQAVALGATLWRWGFGALLNPTVEEAYWNAVSDRGLALHVFARAEGRKAYVEGRPPGTSRSQVEVLEALEEARAYVDDLNPAERAADRTIFPDAPATSGGNARKRNPSKESAARRRASVDLGISPETLRRIVKRPPPTK